MKKLLLSIFFLVLFLSSAQACCFWQVTDPDGNPNTRLCVVEGHTWRPGECMPDVCCTKCANIPNCPAEAIQGSAVSATEMSVCEAPNNC